MVFEKLFRRRHAAPPGPPPAQGDKLDLSTPIVIELARETMAFLQDNAPGWTAGYMRVMRQPDQTSTNGSWAAGSRVEIISAMKHDVYRRIEALGERLMAAMGRQRGVFLLVVQSDFSYEIKFEWDDLDRWIITKLDGATGLPAGL